MAPSRGLRSVICHSTMTHSFRYRLRSCEIRSFTSSGHLPSGHNRWSKIKHDKGKADAAKNRQRSIFAHEITTASKLFGPDANSNPRLADLITKAKREGFAKASIEAAIARGQGRSLSGVSLEPVTVEGILPGNIAVIVECETDSKLRTLAEVRLVIKEHGGTTTPSSYLFTKKGIITFEKKDGAGADETLEAALEAGATDVVEDEQGRVVVSAEPGDLRAVGDAIANALDLEIATSDIVWDPNEETKVPVATEDAADELNAFVDELQEKEPTVQSISMNVSQGTLRSDTWKELQARIGA